MKVYQSEKSINLFPTVNFTWGSVVKVTINLNNQPPSLYIKLPFWFTIHLWAFLFPPFFILWIPSSVYLLPECSFPLSFLTFFHFLIFFNFLLLPSMQSFCNSHKTLWLMVSFSLCLINLFRSKQLYGFVFSVWMPQKLKT